MEMKYFFILFMIVYIKCISSLNISFIREKEKVMTKYNQGILNLSVDQT